jgi:transcription antitermination factor NusG
MRQACGKANVACHGEAVPKESANIRRRNCQMINAGQLSLTVAANAVVNILDIPQWYVAYTYPRHEKAVTDQLERKSVEAFLPTYTQTNQWKDRRVKLELPLFPGYVFARIAVQERLKILSIPGVVRMLSYRGTLTPVSEDEINTIRVCLRQKGRLRPHPYLAVGDLARIREGPFEGVQGIIVRHANGCRLVLSIGLIQQSVAIEMDPDDLEYVAPSLTASHNHLCRATVHDSVGDKAGGAARRPRAEHQRGRSQWQM